MSSVHKPIFIPLKQHEPSINLQRPPTIYVQSLPTLKQVIPKNLDKHRYHVPSPKNPKTSVRPNKTNPTNLQTTIHWRNKEKEPERIEEKQRSNQNLMQGKIKEEEKNSYETTNYG